MCSPSLENMNMQMLFILFKLTCKTQYVSHFTVKSIFSAWGEMVEIKLGLASKWFMMIQIMLLSSCLSSQICSEHIKFTLSAMNVKTVFYCQTLHIVQHSEAKTSNWMNKNGKTVLTGGVVGIALWKTVQCTYQIAIPMQTSQTHRGRGDRFHYKCSSQTNGTHTCLPGDNRGINLTWVYLVYFICQTTDIWKRILFFKLLQFTQLMYFNFK